MQKVFNQLKSKPIIISKTYGYWLFLYNKIQIRRQRVKNQKVLRWGYIPLGIILFICLGTVYSWSVFRGPLEEQFGIGATESGLPYMFFLAFYALLMMVTGPFIDKYKPRVIMIFGGVLVGGGWFLASFAQNIGMLTFTYGVIAGSGVGIIYGVPVAVMSKWFYDKKGLAVGLILSGFGVSPLITAPIAEYLILHFGPLEVFKILGITFLFIITILSIPFKFPDRAYMEQSQQSQKLAKRRVRDLKTKELFKQKKFYGLWICYMFGSLIGLMSVGITTPVGIEVAQLDVKTTVFCVSLFAVFNGVGRPLFGWLTDKLGAMKTALLSYTMIVVASGMMVVAGEGNMVVYIVAFSIIWMTLGSWLAIAPTATGMLFGDKHQSRNYGVVFTAYGVGAVLGVLSSGFLKDMFGSYTYSFYQMLVIAFIGMVFAVTFLKESSCKK